MVTKKNIIWAGLTLVILLGLFLTVRFFIKRNSEKDNSLVAVTDSYNFTATPFDSTLVAGFFAKHPKLQPYQKEVISLYRKQEYHFIWYDAKGVQETAEVLYDKINRIEEEGVQTEIPYKDVFEELFQETVAKPDLQTELFLTSYYFLYADKVYHGIAVSKSKELGWYLPRKKQSYVNYLDSLSDSTQEEKEGQQLMSQYYKLKKALKEYRAIEKKGGWSKITIPESFKSFRPLDSSVTLAQIRTRLFVTGDMDKDSKSNVYDESLQEGVLKYKKRNGFSVIKTLLPKHILEMNVPVGERIKTIMVNMERCRWISKDIVTAKEFLVVNIPSYRLTYVKNGKTVLVSNIVAGNTMHKTVLFSGMMSSIVFSPYWNVPRSIIKKEIEPEMAKNKNYLESHNMEWNNGNIRQKPGVKNSLGLVKFIFPNSNNIYLHDTPSKWLFSEEKRAFSHGCIRVAKPKELANLILEDDNNWTSQSIETAMNLGEEKWYTLKRKIPVHIGYFTAWVDDKGVINFYKDIYERDARLASLLVQE